MKIEFFIRFKLDTKNAYNAPTNLHRTITLSQFCDVDGSGIFPLDPHTLVTLVKQNLNDGWDFDTIEKRKTYLDGTEEDESCLVLNKVVNDFIKELTVAEKH
jgi:hypothetical protein